MAGDTYVLIHGGGADAWYWHLLEPELRARGHDVVAVDLPAEDPSAGLGDYADAVVRAIDGRTDLVLVAHSFGGFTAPLVCERVPVELLVLLTAMIPRPGECVADWWQATAHAPAGAFEDPATFFHDVPPELTAQALARARSGGDRVGGEPWPLSAWPDVPTRFLLCRDDRFFPAPWMRGVVRDRLGIVADEMDGGHCAMLSRPAELAERLTALRAAGRADLQRAP